MNKLLLHICCANCATVPIELLQGQFDLTLFWYNPNIYPSAEYEKRLAEVRKLSAIYKIDLLEESYENEKWQETIKGKENELEGGERCQICFKMRLEKTAQIAQRCDIPYFATSLTVGPSKNAVKINQIGVELAQKYDLKFFEADFKKNDGFKRSLELSKEYNFYRQNYCGCAFSVRQNQAL
ncbi:MAG: epoxyqueuosine reductase QueH [Patescibacteria group bacterium]